MVRSVNVSGQDTKDAKGGAKFDPLPAGPYNVTIFDHEVKQYGPKTANKGRDYLSLQLRISDGQKGANRRLFVNVGDFPKWASGKVNFQFFQFYKALGVEFPEGVDGAADLPDYEDLNGSALAVKVKIVQDDYAFKKALAEYRESGGKGDLPEENDFLKNEVAEFLPTLDETDLVTEDAAEESDEFDL